MDNILEDPPTPSEASSTFMMELMQPFIPIKEAVNGYKQQLIEDGWSDAVAEQIAASMLVEINKNMLSNVFRQTARS